MPRRFTMTSRESGNPLEKHPVNPEIDTVRKLVKTAEAASKEE